MIIITNTPFFVLFLLLGNIQLSASSAPLKALRARTVRSRSQALPALLRKPIYTRETRLNARKTKGVENRLAETWKKATQAGAELALGLMVLSAGAGLTGLQLPALAADGSPAAVEQLNREALKEMTKDAISKGYDQKWIDDHLAEMEARGYDINWVQEHLGSVVQEMKDKAEINPENMMFKDLKDGQAPKQLEESRVVSSIPRTNAEGLPTHQEGLEGIDNWVYPSPKMFWNAMDRKGKHPEKYNPEDISGVVRIHNFVNEKAWNEILKWEKMHEDSCPQGPSLTSFKGKYDKLSGKGALNKYVPGMMGAPFDRHDWVINRCGKTVRYVLDYYKDPSLKEEPKIRLDVRPAPESIDNLKDWVRFSEFQRSLKTSPEVSFERTTQMKTADQVMKEISRAE